MTFSNFKLKLCDVTVSFQSFFYLIRYFFFDIGSFFLLKIVFCNFFINFKVSLSVFSHHFFYSLHSLFSLCIIEITSLSWPRPQFFSLVSTKLSTNRLKKDEQALFTKVCVKWFNRISSSFSAEKFFIDQMNIIMCLWDFRLCSKSDYSHTSDWLHRKLLWNVYLQWWP